MGQRVFSAAQLAVGDPRAEERGVWKDCCELEVVGRCGVKVDVGSRLINFLPASLRIPKTFRISKPSLPPPSSLSFSKQSKLQQQSHLTTQLLDIPQLSFSGACCLVLKPNNPELSVAVSSRDLCALFSPHLHHQTLRFLDFKHGL